MTSKKDILLDTNFFIHLLDNSKPLYKNAESYYQQFLKTNITMYISTITIAEYCVKGEFSDLPIEKLKIIPFTKNHALKSAVLAKTLFDAKKNKTLEEVERIIIPNDTKLLAQAEIEPSIHYYLSLDKQSEKIYNILFKDKKISFKFIDLHIPYNEYFQNPNPIPF